MDGLEDEIHLGQVRPFFSGALAVCFGEGMYKKIVSLGKE